MRVFLATKSGSLLAFQVLVAGQDTPALRRICRTVSVLALIHACSARWSTSLVRLQVVNGNPSSVGLQAAMRQIWSRAAGPNLGGRPPLHFGDNAANPDPLNAWITSRTYPSVAANITAISGADRPCDEASTIPDRRSRTRSRADLVILTSRCASSGSNDRTN